MRGSAGPGARDAERAGPQRQHGDRAGRAGSQPNANFADWLQGVRQEAAAKGVSQQTLDQALGGLEPDQKVLDLDRSQPEFTMTFAQYRARTVTKQRVDQGRNLLDEYRRCWIRSPSPMASSRHSSSPSGASNPTSGGSPAAIPSSNPWPRWPMAAAGRQMFRDELIDALIILQDKNITPDAMTGSWAGAMGQSQFMPSSYLKYAVDYTGDGRRDIWTDQADVFASIANYLASNGWRRDQTWGRPVRLPPGMAESLIGWKNDRPMREWQALGLRNPDGSDLPATDEPVALVAPDGPTGPGLAHLQQLQGHHEMEPLDLFRDLGRAAGRRNLRGTLAALAK